jgi:hypothetical protein
MPQIPHDTRGLTGSFTTQNFLKSKDELDR